MDVLHWPPHRRPRPGINLHRATTEPNTRIHQGLRTTTAADTLAALTRAVDATTLAQATREAEAKRLVPQQPHGISRSEAERAFFTLIQAARLPAPKRNAPLLGYELDALWPQQRLVVEVDGFAFHAGRAAFEKDRARDADLQLAGYTVLRFTWRQITGEPHAVAARIAAALART